MSAKRPNPRPAWLRRRLPPRDREQQVRALLAGLHLQTVCQGARCPNQVECFGRGTATFMILGERCTRSCTFCAVPCGPAGDPDPGEPHRVAAAVVRLGLRYVVLTSVTRDDLADGGSSHFATTVRAIRSQTAHLPVEVLIPDFGGDLEALAAVVAAAPAVLNHNLETVARLYPQVRPQADYHRSLRLLAAAKQLAPGMATKSGFMVGLGERPQEVESLLFDLRRAGCDLVTIGQYLSPSSRHHPVVEYVHPRQFRAYADLAGKLGFKGVAAGPYVRSSYRAEALYRQVSATKG